MFRVQADDSQFDHSNSMYWNGSQVSVADTRDDILEDVQWWNEYYNMSLKCTFKSFYSMCALCSQCDRHYWLTSTIEEQWHSFPKCSEARGIHASSFCGQASCLQQWLRGLSDNNISLCTLKMLLYFICTLSIAKKKLYPDQNLSWQDTAQLKYPPCCFTGTE